MANGSCSTSTAVAKPDRARFAWSQIAEPNLMNKEGLPAGAFNTHWPTDPTLGKKVSGGKPHVSSHPNPYGWNGGVTDGTWGNTSQNCYATDQSPTFPKTVTVDLGARKTIHARALRHPGHRCHQDRGGFHQRGWQDLHRSRSHRFPAEEGDTRGGKVQAEPGALCAGHVP